MASAGKQFKAALSQHSPLPIVGAINAYSGMLAKRAGFQALYLSGAGVANASYGLPDLGVITLNDMLIDADRIISATGLPLLMDVDAGGNNSLAIARMVKQCCRLGVAAIHIEDQVLNKRCGHREGKQLVSTQAMMSRIKAAVDARLDDDFVVMARTDALANEGLAAAIARAKAYVSAGADMVFAEAVMTLEQYQAFVDNLGVPVLANITEFGKTPLFTQAQLASVGVAMVLYPLSAFRAMSQAAVNVYQTIQQEKSQQSLITAMQGRNELYDVLDYTRYEQQLNGELDD